MLGFFRPTVRENPKDREAAVILQDMQNPFLEAYLHFLNFSLSYMNEFNLLFQSRDLLIHKLASSSVGCCWKTKVSSIVGLCRLKYAMGMRVGRPGVVAWNTAKPALPQF